MKATLRTLRLTSDCELSLGSTRTSLRGLKLWCGEASTKAVALLALAWVSRPVTGRPLQNESSPPTRSSSSARRRPLACPRSRSSTASLCRLSRTTLPKGRLGGSRGEEQALPEEQSLSQGQANLSLYAAAGCWSQGRLPRPLARPQAVARD